MTAEPDSESNPFARYLIYFSVYLMWIACILWCTRGQTSLVSWIESWHRWDADWYLRIWMEGYGSDPRMLVFPPGYPWLIGELSEWTGQTFDVVAMAIGLLSFFAACCLSARFISQRFQVPEWAVFLVQILSPVSFYALMPYSDAFFMLLFWIAVPLAARDPRTLHWREKIAAGILLFLMPIVRITGYALLIWTLFRRWFVLTALISLMAYLELNKIYGGDYFSFLHQQRAFMMPPGWLYDGLHYHLWELFHPRIGGNSEFLLFWLQVTVLPLASTVVIVCAGGWFLRRKEFLLGATLLAVALYSRNQFYWRSVLRYDWPLIALTITPFLSFVNSGVRARSSWRRAVAWLTGTAFVLVILAGFVFQIGIARNLHLGGWAY